MQQRITLGNIILVYKTIFQHFNQVDA